MNTLLTTLSNPLFRVVLALLVLLVGWLIAKLISGLVRRLLARIGVDRRINKTAGDAGVPQVEAGIASIVFWLLMLFVLLAFFEVLGLTIITQPLNALLGVIMGWVPQLLAAGVLVLAAWIVAKILRGLVKGALQAAGADKKAASQTGDESLPISNSVGEVVYWLVWLLFLPAILGALGMQSLLVPLQSMFDQFMSYLPMLAAAVVILIVGWFVAKIVRRIVTSFLVAIGTDKFSERVGLAKNMGKQTLSGVLGMIVFVLVLIPVIIAALQALQLTALTAPLTALLTQVLLAVPAILAAFVVLVVAWVIGRLVGDLVAGLLEGVGFDNILSKLGLTRELPSAKWTPSKVVGLIVMIGILLLGVQAAVGLVHWAPLTVMVSAFLLFAARIIIGLIIFALGLWLANLLGSAVMESEWPQKSLASAFVRVVVIVLATAMALQEMQLASSIINLAFGLTLAGIALAIGLAFGLGGRETAQVQVGKWYKRLSAPPEDEAALEEAPNE
jgi:Mechanosensitive ion channel, conserved TM helix